MRRTGHRSSVFVPSSFRLRSVFVPSSFRLRSVFVPSSLPIPYAFSDRHSLHSSIFHQGKKKTYWNPTRYHCAIQPILGISTSQTDRRGIRTPDCRAADSNRGPVRFGYSWGPEGSEAAAIPYPTDYFSHDSKPGPGGSLLYIVCHLPLSRAPTHSTRCCLRKQTRMRGPCRVWTVCSDALHDPACICICKIRLYDYTYTYTLQMATV